MLRQRFAWLVKRELYAGAKAVGEPLVTIKEQCNRTRSSSGKHPIKLLAFPSQNNEEITTMLATSFFGIDRRFNLLGEGYQWRRVGPWYSGLRCVDP